LLARRKKEERIKERSRKKGLHSEESNVDLADKAATPQKVRGGK